MGRISALTALLCISAILLPNHYAHGQTTSLDDSTTQSVDFPVTTTTEAGVTTTNSAESTTQSVDLPVTTTTGAGVVTTNSAESTTQSVDLPVTTTTEPGVVTTNSAESTTQSVDLPVTTTTAAGVVTTNSAESTTQSVDWSFDTTTEAGVVMANSDECTDDVEAGRSYCKSTTLLPDLPGLIEDPNFDLCSVSFPQYSCADLDKVTDAKAFQMLKCSMLDDNSDITQGAVSLFLSKRTMDSTGTIVNMINRQVPSASIRPKFKEYFVKGIFEKLLQDVENMTPGSLAVWSQEKLYSFMPAMNPDVLNCISTAPVSCDGLEAIVNGMALHYSTYSNESRDEIGMWITRFAKSRSCQKDTIANSITSFYKDFQANMNFADFEEAFGSQDWIPALNIFNEVQLQQYVEATKAFESSASASPVLDLLKTKSFDYNFDFMYSLPEASISSYDKDVKYSLMNNLLDKRNSVAGASCKRPVRIVFSLRVQFLTLFDEDMMQKMEPTDCAEFQDMGKGFDDVYDKLPDQTKQLVYNYRTNYLNAEAKKSGSGCTYAVNSKEWLEKNYGKSAELASYDEFKRLNPNFDGYQAVVLLNNNQTIDLLIQTNMFTFTPPSDFETNIPLVIDAISKKGFANIKLFLMELKTKISKVYQSIIITMKVRSLMLESLYSSMEPEFKQFQANDWQNLMNSMNYLTPAISNKQLTQMSNGVVKDCSSMQAIVGSLSSVSDNMDDNSKTEVTDWISSFLGNETSRCKSKDEDWVKKNYWSFHISLNIKIVLKLNPEYDLVDNMDKLTSKQLGQLVMQKSEAHTNVTLVKMVFDVLSTGTHEVVMKNLADFWNSFITEYEKADNFTNDVKYEMLSSTVTELSSSFVTFTAEDTTLWFETRMYPVMPVIDSEVLNEISPDVGCEFQTSFVQAASFVSDEMAELNKDDVVGYIQKFLENDKKNGNKCTKQETSTVISMQKFYGDFGVVTSYEEMKTCLPGFNAFESGVIQRLTVEQIGDMMAVEAVYDSEEKVDKVFEYLNTQDIKTAQEVMTRFSETGYTKNIQITNEAVGQKIVRNYMNIIKDKVASYTVNQVKRAIGVEIIICVQFFLEKQLDIFDVRSCATVDAMFPPLNKAFSKMSESTKSNIAGWMVKTLKKPSINGCTSGKTTTVEWVDNTMNEFFKYASLKDLKTINPQLDVLSIITRTSVSQKVEYLCTSNALTDVTVTRTVLESLQGEDNVTSAQQVVTFLGEFNTAYNQLSIKTMTAEVREEVMSTLFSSYISDLNSLTDGEISQFPDLFSNIVPSITVEMVKKIPVNMNCDSYKSIFGGINQAYDQYSDDVKKAVLGKMISYLDYNRKGLSDVCSNLYSDTRSYMQVIFMKFSKNAALYDLKFYCSKFNAYTALDVFSGTQLASQLINTTAIKNQMEAAQILVELGKRDYTEVYSFMTEMERVTKENKITKLSDSNVQNMIFQTVWPTVTQHIKTTAEWKDWFGGKMDLMISSCTADQIASLSEDIDCTSQKYVVKCFGNAYANLGDDQRSAMHNRIRSFNKAVKASSGNACPTESGSSSEWIREFHGAFKPLATIEEYQEENSNFNAISALDECTGSQVAAFVIQSRALTDEETIVTVLDSIDSADKAKDFLDQLNKDAPEELQSSPVGKLILDKTLQVLAPDMLGYQSNDWKQLMQGTLKNVLHNVNETDLETITYPLTCASYQEVIAGLNDVFDIMKEESRIAVYNKCIKKQLNSVVSTTGIKCGQKKMNTEVWLSMNCAKFCMYIEPSEFIEWNKEYNPINVINSLSPKQLADLAASSVTKEEVACQVAARVQELDVNGANDFLDEMSKSLKKNNIKIRNNVVAFKILSSSLLAIDSSLPLLSSSEWQDLMSNKLQPLMFSMKAEQLNTMLDSADCNAYKSILDALNDNYDNFEADARQSIFETLYSHVTKKNSASGFCPQNTDNSFSQITNTVGKFSSYLKFSQFIAINPKFDWVSAVDNLTPSQLADASLNDNVFADENKAKALNGRLQKLSFSDTDTFLRSFQAIAQEKNLEAIPIGSALQSIFSTVFDTVSSQFLTMSNDQWNDYFGSTFSKFLPSFQAKQFEKIPETISCTAFQSVVAGLSKSYGQLQPDVQSAFYNKINSFLSKTTRVNGVACPSSGNSGDWIKLNYGASKEQASYGDFVKMNPQFIAMDAMSQLSPTQLGTYIANKDILSDKTKVEMVMSAMNSETIGTFMDAFNAACEKNGITTITNEAVKKFMLGEYMCKIGSQMSAFTSTKYHEVFQGKLKMVLSTFDAKTLGFIPTDISCDSLAAIMEPLMNIQNPEDPTAVFNFVNSVLTNQQKSTGSACLEGDSKEWCLKYWGKYLKAGSWKAISALDPDFDLTSTTDLLSATQLADATAGTASIHNVTVISTVMTAVIGDLNSMSTFVSSLKTYYASDPTLLSNSKVRDTVMSAVAETVFSNFDTLPVSEIDSWMNKISFLLPAVNETILESIPKEIDCIQLQTFVQHMDDAFTSLTQPRQKDVANFIKGVLSKKVDNSEDPCTANAASTTSWAQKNIASYCRYLTADEMAKINPKLVKVSYEGLCGMPS